MSSLLYDNNVTICISIFLDREFWKKGKQESELFVQDSPHKFT